MLVIDRGEQESPISENMLFDHAARFAAWSTSLSERYISKNMLFDFTGRSSIGGASESLANRLIYSNG